MEFSFKGKRALVTGAAGFIGRAITELLVKCEATVVAVDVRADELHSIYKDCPQVIPVVCDLTNWDETKKTVAKQLPIDLLVNSAAIFNPKPFDEQDLDLIDKHYDINVKAIINISQVIIKDLIARKAGGAIVNMSSTISSGGAYGASLYSSTKAAVISLTETMAVEYGKHGIRINAVRPGGLISPLLKNYMDFFPVFDDKALIGSTVTGRVSTPEDIASAVVFLLSANASNITGTSITVDGGASTRV